MAQRKPKTIMCNAAGLDRPVMSASGQKRTFHRVRLASALPPKADQKIETKLLAAGGSFAVNGMPFAFCDAGVLFELP